MTGSRGLGAALLCWLNFFLTMCTLDRDWVVIRGFGATLLRWFQSTGNGGLHPGTNFVPHKRGKNTLASNGCFHPCQRQGQGPSQRHSFQVCTLSLAMAKETGVRAWCRLGHTGVVLASQPEPQTLFNLLSSHCDQE